MSDLVEFLLARIADEERWSQMAGHGYGHQPLLAPRNAGWTDIDITENCRPSCDAEFIRQWSPERVRAECEAKRQIVQVAEMIYRTEPPWANLDDAPAVATFVLGALATVYADHPDYRVEWRP